MKSLMFKAKQSFLEVLLDQDAFDTHEFTLSASLSEPLAPHFKEQNVNASVPVPSTYRRVKISEEPKKEAKGVNGA